MKTTTLIVLVLYTSTVAFFGMQSVKNATLITNSESTFPIDEQIGASFHYSVNSSDVLASVKATDKKKYRIFFENRSSKKLVVTIRYRDINGKWIIEEGKTLKSGEEQEMGTTYSNVYFYHATSKRKLNKKIFAVKYQGDVYADAMTRLGLTKQDIWECYSTEACNSFAVFE
jgi:hypothetical protein